MHRSHLASRSIALGVVMTLVAAVLASIVSPGAAIAQTATAASVSLHLSPAVADQPFRTVAVALEPGDSRLAALGATLIYDPERVVVSSCDVSEAGACNVEPDGRVLVSVFSLSRLQSNDQLLTVNFEPVPGAGGSAVFAMTVETAVTFQGDRLPEIVVAPIETEPAAATEAQFGSLTGDVISADFETALFALDVCATNDVTQAEFCTTTSGLGTWRIDDLPVGDYTIVVSDATGVYSPAAMTAPVLPDQVIAGNDAAMVYADESIDESSDSTNTDGTGAEAPEPEVIVYEASIAGRVTAIDTQQPLEAAQVCATQPLVLHQSCATTDANGVFALSDLSTGNYWVTVVDPLAQFEAGRPKLVGVVGDDVVRAGVELRLTPISE